MTAGADSDVRVGFYSANTRHFLLPLARVADVEAAFGHWLEHCRDDVQKAIQDDRLDVICLLGLGSYGHGLDKHLSKLLDCYDKYPGVGLLRYIVKGTPGE